MDFQLGNDVLKDKSVVMVYGKQDPFLTDERFTEMKSLIEKLNVPVDIATFQGGHDIEEKALVQLFL